MSSMDPVAIDGGALWARLEELAGFGARRDGGVNRPAMSEVDRAARRRLVEWATALGCTSHVDPAGNMFFRHAGTEEAEPVLVGSHIDSQPNGGKYDGAYGVMVGFALLEAVVHRGIRHRRPIEVAVWNNEEGSRFAPGAMGSALFAGALDMAALNEVRDGDGARLVDELAATIADARGVGAGERPLRFGVHAFIEAHIEQGPVLEAEELPIGVVTGTQGLRWYRFSVRGAAAHAGTTPRARRRDAFLGASELAAALRESALDPEDAVRFTIGRFRLSPDTPNTVPESAAFTVDLRHIDESRLAALDKAFIDLASRSWTGCTASVERAMALRPVAFDAAVAGALQRSVEACGYPYRHIVSGAFHDATHIASVCPTAMLFIRCVDGISHNPEERIDPADALAGAEVTAGAVLALAGT